MAFLPWLKDRAVTHLPVAQRPASAAGCPGAAAAQADVGSGAPAQLAAGVTG
jgi:hypothetical protein